MPAKKPQSAIPVVAIYILAIIVDIILINAAVKAPSYEKASCSFGERTLRRDIDDEPSVGSPCFVCDNSVVMQTGSTTTQGIFPQPPFRCIWPGGSQGGLKNPPPPTTVNGKLVNPDYLSLNLTCDNFTAFDQPLNGTTCYYNSTGLAFLLIPETTNTVGRYVGIAITSVIAVVPLPFVAYFLWRRRSQKNDVEKAAVAARTLENKETDFTINEVPFDPNMVAARQAKLDVPAGTQPRDLSVKAHVTFQSLKEGRMLKAQVTVTVPAAFFNECIEARVTLTPPEDPPARLRPHQTSALGFNVGQKPSESGRVVTFPALNYDVSDDALASGSLPDLVMHLRITAATPAPAADVAPKEFYAGNLTVVMPTAGVFGQPLPSNELAARHQEMAGQVFTSITRSSSYVAWENSSTPLTLVWLAAFLRVNGDHTTYKPAGKDNTAEMRLYGRLMMGAVITPVMVVVHKPPHDRQFSVWVHTGNKDLDNKLHQELHGISSSSRHMPVVPHDNGSEPM